MRLYKCLIQERKKEMKKIRNLGIIFAGLLLTLSACGADAHTHTFSSDWSKDAEYHWHAATCEHTEEVSEKAKHTWNEGRVVTPATCHSVGVKEFACTVCGQTKQESISTLDHSWESGWSRDADYHWKKCTSEGCNEIAQKAEHTWDAGTNIRPADCHNKELTRFECTVCGQTKEVEGELGDHVWESGYHHDVTHHWKECTVDGCDATTTKEAHQWDAGTTGNNGVVTYACLVCGEAQDDTSISLLAETKITSEEIFANQFSRNTDLGTVKRFGMNNCAVSSAGFVDLTIGGKVFNVDSLNEIKTVTIVASSTNASSYRLYYGDSVDTCNFFLEKNLEAASSEVSATFTLDFAANYFSIVNSGSEAVVIDAVSVSYTGVKNQALASEFCVAMQQQYFLGKEIDVPVGQVILGSEVLNATKVVKDPDGLVTNGNKIILNKLGTYSVEYTVTKGESKFVKVVEFDSVDDVKFISSYNPAAVQGIQPGTPNGLTFNLNEGDELFFNEMTDVSVATFAGSYVFLAPGLSVENNAKFRVTLNDVTHPSNYLEVVYQTYAGNTKASVWARASNQHGNYNGFDVNFDSHSFLIIFDYAAKKIGAGNKDNVFDLADTSFYGTAWGGFTDGNVYMKLECLEADGGVANCTADWVYDSRSYAVSGKPSSRDGTTFNLAANSNYVLSGYHVDVPTTDCSFFLFRLVFTSTVINATIKVKVINTADETDFMYVVVESLSDARLRFSISRDGNPDLDNLMQTNRYIQSGQDLNVVWDGASKIIRSTNTQQATYGGVASASLGTFNPTSVKFEFQSDVNISFGIDYLGDTLSWLTNWAD